MPVHLRYKWNYVQLRICKEVLWNLHSATAEGVNNTTAKSRHLELIMPENRN